MPDGSLMLQNCFSDFAVEYQFGCRTTEPGFARDIGHTEICLIGWFKRHVRKRKAETPIKASVLMAKLAFNKPDDNLVETRPRIEDLLWQDSKSTVAFFGIVYIVQVLLGFCCPFCGVQYSCSLVVFGPKNVLGAVPEEFNLLCSQRTCVDLLHESPSAPNVHQYPSVILTLLY